MTEEEFKGLQVGDKIVLSGCFAGISFYGDFVYLTNDNVVNCMVPKEFVLATGRKGGSDD